MRLLVTTPLSVIVNAEDVRHVRAEDETGSFGILPGHADFISVLAVSVITWRNHKDEEHHVAVRGGLLSVRDGNSVEVATREAVAEDTLGELGQAVLERFREEAHAEKESRVSVTRLHLAAIRQLQRYLQSGRQPIPRGPPPTIGASTARGGPPGEGEVT
ncbi:MAG: F0F1 ATP synthase subunit epsilon [Rhodospirillales bacterium]|nr:F0F1 ATP synthase subunit epsilon [Rhodospirillales bacterium]MDH3919162.1 F0F1 ATP synthase subunit epsilon [Rhodospirillales bacterium]MDH3966969.1 F0F1 ATP synthase subunit epsilon [Rhodospirillales bacterium]